VDAHISFQNGKHSVDILSFAERRGDSGLTTAVLTLKATYPDAAVATDTIACEAVGQKSWICSGIAVGAEGETYRNLLLISANKVLVVKVRQKGVITADEYKSFQRMGRFLYYATVE
jgi:hypothetical protein